MKTNLIDSPDKIHARMTDKNAAHVARWGVECREWVLADVAEVTFDRRRYQRNFDLLDALEADGRFEVNRSPAHFADTRIAIKSP